MSPFDDIRAVLAQAPAADAAARNATAERLARVEAAASLGGLADLALWAAAWSGRAPPTVSRPVIALYAGAHASSGSTDRARRALEALASGQAPAAVLARRLGAGLDAYDLAVDRPVPDVRELPAMTERACAATLAFGMEALAKGPDLLLIGAVDDASAAPSLEALLLALTGRDAGRRAAAAAAVERARAAGANSPLAFLAQLGGRETAALAGAIAAARVQRTPVVLDGLASAVAALVLHRERPGSADHCRAAGAADARHALVLAELGTEPLLPLGMTCGEGVGAAAALPLIQSACALTGSA